jgi:hypothetical protein
MNPIAMSPDGTYIDLSMILAIGPVKREQSVFSLKFKFDVWFNPSGVPFKQEPRIVIPIVVEYDRPYDLYLKEFINETKQEANAKISYDLYVEQKRVEVDKGREKLAEEWKEYRNGL